MNARRTTTTRRTTTRATTTASAPATTATRVTTTARPMTTHSQKDFEGCAKGKYAWTDTGSTKAEDLGDAIRDYAFSDGSKKASVYVDLDGLDALADADLCVTKVSETRVEFTAAFPSGKRCLTLSPLHASIDEASLLRKPGKNRIILKLKKTTPEAWSTLLTAPPPAQPDPSAMGGLGGMDMESMMKSMAGMAGVPDPPDLGGAADDTGADPEEAGSDLDDCRTWRRTTWTRSARNGAESSKKNGMELSGDGACGRVYRVTCRRDKKRRRHETRNCRRTKTIESRAHAERCWRIPEEDAADRREIRQGTERSELRSLRRRALRRSHTADGRPGWRRTRWTRRRR